MAKQLEIGGMKFELRQRAEQARACMAADLPGYQRKHQLTMAAACEIEGKFMERLTRLTEKKGYWELFPEKSENLSLEVSFSQACCQSRSLSISTTRAATLSVSYQAVQIAGSWRLRAWSQVCK